ncbi:MAG: hypothetical protein AB7F41_05810 [Methylocystis sp.]|uniref:hypothetical protein n=1 Tax=Methylocystis sp. TaxID=1911079 RepID=UPI003D1005AD
MAAGVATGAGAWAEECMEGPCRGLFAAGPYRLQFFATQKGAAERFYRQIPNFGPTRLNVEFIGYESGDASGEATADTSSHDLETDVALSWGKNDLAPPELLKTVNSRGLAPISFGYFFAEDGKYIVAVAAKSADGAIHRGQHVVFVIGSADSDYLVAGAASLFILTFAFIVWRRRQLPLTPPAPRR